jgi:hypothetical protein
LYMISRGSPAAILCSSAALVEGMMRVRRPVFFRFKLIKKVFTGYDASFELSWYWHTSMQNRKRKLPQPRAVGMKPRRPLPYRTRRLVQLSYLADCDERFGPRYRP